MANPTLKVFQLVILDDVPDTGAEYIALVDQPAIEKCFMAFAQQKPTVHEHFFAEDKRIITGPVMIPDLPIYRSATKEIPEPHMVVFDADTIRQIVHKFSRQGNFNNVNQMHVEGTDPKDVYMIESFMSDASRGIQAPEHFKDLPDGTWFVSYKVDNPDVWNRVKEGKFRGLSVEGIFAYVENDISDEERAMNQIAALIESWKD